MGKSRLGWLFAVSAQPSGPSHNGGAASDQLGSRLLRVGGPLDGSFKVSTACQSSDFPAALILPLPYPLLQGPRTHLARSHSCVNASVMSPRPFSVLVGLSCWSMNSLVPVWPRVPISTKCSGIRGSTREAELAGDRNPHRRGCTPTKPTRRHTNQQRPETQANRRE